jgi:TnpA family transposase
VLVWSQRFWFCDLAISSTLARKNHPLGVLARIRRSGRSAAALREIGRIERTLFTLELLQSPGDEPLHVLAGQLQGKY